jgi:predicted transcriptional regulator
MPISRSFDYEEWFDCEVKLALDEAYAGKLVEHETVVKKWERKRAAIVDPTR